MILDYHKNTGAYSLRVPRASGIDPNTLMREHGLDFAISLSNNQTAVMMTHEPYAAASFGEYATPAARGELHGILTEIENSRRLESQAHIKCPADKELWSFQKADIEYALRRRNTLVGDQPGLGKTPIGICFANEIAAKRVLVICPASVRIQWVKRIREWTTLRWPYTIHSTLHSRHGVHPNAEWTVVSYDLARSGAIGSALSKGTYDLLILDEAHYLKTPDSKRTRAIFGGGREAAFAPLASRCGAVLALTGTPLPNRPREAYTLARALCWDSIDWKSQEAFEHRFNPSIKGERIDAVTGRTKIYVDERSGRHGELQNRLRANFMTRHLKREVMPQLKMPVYDIIDLDESGAAVKQALAAESLLHIDPDLIDDADVETLGHLSVARRMMGIALAPQIADYIDDLILGGEEKLVVFAWHIEVMNMLEQRWQKHNVLRIDGNTSSVKKDRLVNLFQKDRKHQVILGNTLSMGTGVDGLQHVAAHALIAEPDWTPGNNIQCFDRLDRGGQTRTVQGDIFVAPSSLAARILKKALTKLQTTDKALDRRY